MKAFFDKYKYILGLVLALVVVIIIAVVSAVAGKDTAENSDVSYQLPETSSFTDTESHIEATITKTSINFPTQSAATATDKISQASIQTTVQTTFSGDLQTVSQTDTGITSPDTTTANTSITPASTTESTASATPVPKPTAPPKPATTVKTPTTTPKPTTTAKATTTTVKTSATTPKPITTVTNTSKATTTAAAKVTTTAKTTATTVRTTTTKGADSQPIKKYDNSCSFVIECKTILDNKDKLRKGLIDYVPTDGMIFGGTVGFDSGESVYDILRRICDENKIQMESSFTPAFGSYYVEGINNLYEFDCGGSSGWMYSVNGAFPNYGCSSYIPENNDKIAFRYTCELGYDL